MYTTYTIQQQIPFSKNGYVITPNGDVHVLRYRFSHNAVIVKLFNGDVSSSIDDCFTLPVLNFVDKQPIITLSFHQHPAVYWNKGLTRQQVESAGHILKYVYGFDSDETIQFTNTDKQRSVRAILFEMSRSICHEIA